MNYLNVLQLSRKATLFWLELIVKCNCVFTRVQSESLSVSTGSNGQLDEGSKGLVLLQLMPPERLLLCGGRPFNTEPEAGALEITELRVSEIAPAILIMSPTLIPYVHWLQAQRERERWSGFSQSPHPPSLPIVPSAAPTASGTSLKIAALWR